MKPITLSAHFPDARDAKRVAEAAKAAGKSPSAFIRDAALAAAGACPACGRAHEPVKKSKRKAA